MVIGSRGNLVLKTSLTSVKYVADISLQAAKWPAAGTF